MTALPLLRGTTATLGRVEASAFPGPGDIIVAIEGGRRIPAEREHAIRVRSALEMLGALPDDREIRVKLPAGVTASGDLAVAVAALAAIGDVPAHGLLVGELSLFGDLRATRGVIPAILAAEAAELPWVVVPLDNRDEAEAAVRGGAAIPVYLARSLDAVRAFVRGFGSSLEQATAGHPPLVSRDLAWHDVPAGCAEAAEQVRKAVVDDGARALLLVGPPGSGKTMIARRINSILPSPTAAERLEIDAIASAAGLGLPAAERPFRAPHHTVSAGACVGGGEPVRPGEVSLAHRGVLLLDEITEFRRDALDSLARVIRDGVAVVGRTDGNVTMPAAPAVVVLAANPCPCAHRVCKCTTEQLARHDLALKAVRARFGAVRIDLPEYSRRVRVSQQGG